MTLNLTDLLNNAPFCTVTLTALVVLLVEANRKGRARLSSWITLIGLLTAGVLATRGFIPDTESFGGMALIGGFASYTTLVFVLSAFLTVLLSQQYFERLENHRGEYYILILFATAGMILMASANDLIIMFLGIELMSVCLYILAGFMRTKDRSNEAALKYFLLGAFSTGFLLYGIALLYGATGSTNLTVIGRVTTAGPTNIFFLLGVGLLIMGLSFKVSAVPFHMWAPDVYEGAPTTVTAFMSTGAKAAAFAAYLTVFVRSIHISGSSISDVIAFIAAASMILGNVTAIAQVNIKRMLAYSSIAHAGYMLSGIAAGTEEGRTGVLFYIAAYTVMNLGAFGVVSIMERAEEKNLQLEDYAGLSTRRPGIAALMALFMFALSGIPPFAGFFGKYYVFLAAVQGGLTWLAIIGVLTSLVSAYYYLRIVVLMYFREGQGDIAANPTMAVRIALAVSAFLVLLLGVYPSFALRLTQTIF
ncbi:MAG: NADH-quinone oxidoreductase subunit N [Bacteroidota bacterium]